MESLVYLSKSDDAEEDENRRPTPLDPEYWRGITHSYDSAPDPAFLADNGYDVRSYRRPVTAPPQSYYGAYGSVQSERSSYPGGGLVTSPVHYQDGPHQYIPVSPVAHTTQAYGNGGGYHGAHGGAGYGGYTPESNLVAQYPHPGHSEWGVSSSGRDSSAIVPPSQLKAQLRDAFVRAQTYLDLVPFFQSCDPTCAGGISAHTLQEALALMGVVVGNPLVNTIAQLFSIPGRGLLDYVALSRFLELDAQEIEDIRSLGAARFAILVNAGIDLSDVFAQEDIRRSGFVSRATFTNVLRTYGFPIAEPVLHFLMVQLAKSVDTMSVSYARFLEMIGGSTSAATVWTRPLTAPSRSVDLSSGHAST